MSVLIFHPSTAGFVQQAARSLEEAGQLDRFLTTVVDDPLSPLQRFFRGAGRLTGRDLEGRFRRRAVTEISPDRVETCRPWGELLRLAVGSIDSDGRLTDLVWERAETGFDRAVARRLRPGLTGVYGLEHCALAAFQRSRELGIRTAYEVPAVETGTVQRILQGELEKFPDLRTAYHRHTAAREHRRMARRRSEWDLANLVIVASNFTRASYQAAGRDVANVKVVPLGAPPPAPREQALRAGEPGAGPLRLMWAGSFKLSKGAHYLLQAWREHGFERHARLDVYGRVTLPESVRRDRPAGIELHGPIPRTELLARYGQADALIFPTLCDGFGMVLTEAFSRGLPVIVSDRAGAGELMEPGVNGLRIPAGSAAAIAEAIDWCLGHRRELQAMREPALAAAARWQWSDFRRRHGEVLREAGLFSVS